MQSFSSLYDSDKSTKAMYDSIQALQSQVFSMLILGGRCSSAIENISVTDVHGTLSVDLSSVMRALELSDGNFVVMGIVYILKTGGHYGGIIFDMSERTFTLYDPSFNELSKEGIISDLTTRVSSHTKYTYVPIPCFMDFQHETTDYYCSLWTMMIMYLVCTSNNHINDVVERFSRMVPSDLEREIGGFIQFVYNYMDSMSLLDAAKNVRAFVARLISDNKVHQSVKQHLIVSVKYSTNPTEFINTLDLYPDLKYLDYVQNIYSLVLQYTSNREVLSFIEALSMPMDQSTFIAGVELLYSLRSARGKYLPIRMYEALADTYPEMNRFMSTLKDISYIVRFSFNRDSIARLSNVLEQSFTQFYGLPSGGEYKVYNFINEFYLRYFFLDTYNIRENDYMNVLQYRQKQYLSLLLKYHIQHKVIIQLIDCMTYSPIRYIDLERFVISLPSVITDESISTAMIGSSLIKSPQSLHIYRKRIDALLSSSH